MKFQILSSLVYLAVTLSPTVVLADDFPHPPVPYFAGFNLGAQRADWACKTTADYLADFEAIKRWSNGPKAQFSAVKLFSTADCDALANAVPAAKQAGIKIWAGVWAVDQAKFDNEKGALERALQAHGSDWLLGINVGSESLYRKEIDPYLLAEHIWDVKGMVQIAYNARHVPVGCADTWTSWVDGNNRPVIDAVDVVLMNAFPYWQGVPVSGALTAFETALQNTRNAVGEKPIVVGETGWPTKGDKFGEAEATEDNLRRYWQDAACWLQEGEGDKGRYPWFWFSALDEPQRWEGDIERNFGFAKVDRTPKVTNWQC